MDDSKHNPRTGASLSDDPDASLDHGPLEPIVLVGFPRRGDPRRRRRLYKTPKSDTYVEIKVADIVDPPSKIEDLDPGEIAIWVAADAEVTLVGYPVSSVSRPFWPRH